jgi:dTDP-4-dehydrorhamnose reductase
MKILLFGGRGQLGTDLVIAAEGRHEVAVPSHDEVDVTDADAVAAVVRERRPAAVVNAAAFHRVDVCEEQPKLAFRTNAVGALNAARAANEVGAVCVFVSTDYVFDGARADGYEEDALTAPINVYGVSKAAGERLVRISCPNSLVVRGSGMFGHAGSSGKGGNFVETILAKAAAGEPISVVDDQVFSPTATRDMAERILLLLERRVAPGIYHAANAGSCSWYGFARRIFELAGVEADLKPRPSAGDHIRRPKYSVLLDTRSVMLGLPAQRGWEDALAWYLEARPARAKVAGA